MDGPLPPGCHIKAWNPAIPGLREVLHARMVDFAYPPHCHDTWTLLILDYGAIRYDVDKQERGAAGPSVTVLPPGVVHDGRPAPTAGWFRKRNLYLEAGFLPAGFVGAAVKHTGIADPALRGAIARLHNSLAAHEDSIDAEARLAAIADRIAEHLGASPMPTLRRDAGIAARLRELLDEHTTDPITLQQAATVLDRSVSHLVRTFTRLYGVSPHAYVIGRRVDAARRLLLAGIKPAEVAATVGFYDQSHLTRHFKRHTSLAPAAFARSHS